jgi:hypothetical protein
VDGRIGHVLAIDQDLATIGPHQRLQDAMKMMIEKNGMVTLALLEMFLLRFLYIN